MTAFSLGARLPLGVSSNLAFSLPQSYRLNPERSPTAPSSEGAEAATAARHRITAMRKLHSSHSTLFRIPDYLLQIALLPQGSAMPVAVTGKPISSAETLPPNFFILTPSTYSMVEAESPVV